MTFDEILNRIEANTTLDSDYLLAVEIRRILEPLVMMARAAHELIALGAFPDTDDANNWMEVYKRAEKTLERANAS